MINSKKVFGTILTNGFGLCTITLIGIILLILCIIIHGGYQHLSFEFIGGTPQQGMTEGGIFPAIFGTFLLVVLMSIAVIPFGIITAIYLCEYSQSTSNGVRIIRFAVTTLSGIPSIVFGLFGLGFFVQFVGGSIDKLFSAEGQIVWGQPCILWASLTMALLTLPVVIVSVEESIRAVPKELRDASCALGASKWQTIWHVVLPQSVPGILTGGILAVSRGAGEVAPILFTGAAYYLPYLPQKLTDQFMELGYHIYIMSTQSTNVSETLPIQYATTLVLLFLTFALNFSAIFFRASLRKKLKN